MENPILAKVCNSVQEAGFALRAILDPEGSFQRRLIGRRALGWTIGAVCFIGFYMGFFIYPIWQVSIETAQVIGGKVVYPHWNPVGMFHSKVWTIHTQLCGLLLWAGMTEQQLTYLLSGLMGMISYLGLGLIVFAFSRSFALSVAGPLIIHFGAFYDFNDVYGISLMHSKWTFGILGLGWIVLTHGLIAVGAVRTGFFMAGLSPCVHPVMGAYCWLITVAAYALFSLGKGRGFKGVMGPFLLGVGISAISFMFQRLMILDVAPVDQETALIYMRAFLEHWGYHQKPISWLSPPVLLNVSAIIIAYKYLRTIPSYANWPAVFASGRRDCNRQTHSHLKPGEPLPVFYMCATLASGFLALGLMGLVSLPAELIPSAVMTLIPARFLNFNILALPAVTLGLLGARIGERPVIWFLLFAAIVTISANLYLGEESRGVSLFVLLWAMGLYLFISGKSVDKPKPAVHKTGPIGFDRLSSKGFKSAMILTALALVIMGSLPFVVLGRHEPYYRNNTFWREVGAAPGSVLGSSLTFLQLRSGRPIICFWPETNNMGYVPEAGPHAREICKRIYKVDILDPPATEQIKTWWDPGFYKETWEERPRGAWLDLGRRFGFCAVLTPAGWKLDLPKVASNDKYDIFRVPRNKCESGSGFSARRSVFASKGGSNDRLGRYPVLKSEDFQMEKDAGKSDCMK